MRDPVDLDGEAPRGAIEIDNELPDRMLSPEFDTHRLAAEQTPEQHLGE
jgi:hypothetical protein